MSLLLSFDRSVGAGAVKAEIFTIGGLENQHCAISKVSHSLTTTKVWTIAHVFWGIQPSLAVIKLLLSLLVCNVFFSALALVTCICGSTFNHSLTMLLPYKTRGKPALKHHSRTAEWLVVPQLYPPNDRQHASSSFLPRRDPAALFTHVEINLRTQHGKVGTDHLTSLHPIPTQSERQHLTCRRSNTARKNPNNQLDNRDCHYGGVHKRSRCIVNCPKKLYPPLLVTTLNKWHVVGSRTERCFLDWVIGVFLFALIFLIGLTRCSGLSGSTWRLSKSQRFCKIQSQHFR